MKRQSLSDLADASNKKMRTDVDKTTMPFSPIISDPELALRQFSTLLGSCSVQNLSRTNYTGLSCLLEYLADDDRDLHTGAFCSFPSLSMSTTNPLGSFSFIKEEQNSAKDFEISSSAPALSPPNGSIAQESLQSKLERSATLKLSRPLCANRPTISEVPATVVKNIRESLLSVIESRLRRCIILLKKTKIDTKRNSLRAKCLYNIWKALKMPTIVTSFVAVNASATDPAPKKVIQSSLDSRSTVSVPVTFLTVADIAFGEQHIVTVEIIAPGTISGIHKQGIRFSTIDVNIDTAVLFKHLNYQAKLVVAKAVALAANVLPFAEPPSANPQAPLERSNSGLMLPPLPRAPSINSINDTTNKPSLSRKNALFSSIK